MNESPRQDENFGTFGLSLSFFVSELRPFKVKDKFFQCIFEALFINSANALLLTAVIYKREDFCYDNYKRRDAADDEGGVDIELISDDDLIIWIRELTFHF